MAENRFESQMYKVQIMNLLLEVKRWSQKAKKHFKKSIQEGLAHTPSPAAGTASATLSRAYSNCQLPGEPPKPEFCE